MDSSIASDNAFLIAQHITFKHETLTRSSDKLSRTIQVCYNDHQKSRNTHISIFKLEQCTM